MYCKNCGKQIEPTFKFCNQCGCSLVESEKKIIRQSHPQKSANNRSNIQQKKVIAISVAIAVIVIVMFAILFCYFSANNKLTTNNQTVINEFLSTTEASTPSSTETTTKTRNKDVIFNALKYNSTTTIKEIMTAYPNGQLEDGIYLTDTSADLKRYLYKNFSFNFADGKLQSIFIDYEVALYTNEKNCPGEPYVCNSTDEFLPLFGLSGGQISDSGYLYIADNCGIYEFICFHNGANIENVEICYTDLILYYN